MGARLVNPIALVGGIAGLVLLWRDGGDRRVVAAVTGAAVLGYDVLLSGGAAFHDYWSYWSVAPLAMGVARTCRWLVDDPLALARPVVSVVSIVVLLAPLWALVPSDPADIQAAGVDAAVLVRRLPEPPDAAVWLVDPTPWVRYERDDFNADLDLASGCHDKPLYTVLVRLDTAPAALADSAIDREGAYALVEADAVRADIDTPLPRTGR